MSDSLINDLMGYIVGLTAIGCFTGMVITWIKWRRNKLPEAKEVAARLNDIAERLARLENTAEATAVEVERISEGQRFTTKLLASKEQPHATR